MRGSGLMWLVLAVAVGISMFLVKYKVQDLENELTAKREQIAAARTNIRVLEAEWANYNDPANLRRLSGKYLGFGPPVPQNHTEIEALPMRGAPAPESPTQVDAPVPGLTAPVGPTIDAEASPLTDPGATTAFQRPAGLPVLLARLQRMLLPEAVGATTSQARSP